MFNGRRLAGWGDRWRERIAERFAERAADDRAVVEQPAAMASAFPLPPGTTVERDLAYGPHPAQRLDVYRMPPSRGMPIVVMVHGGGWRRGDKALPAVVGHKVAHWVSRGWGLVSINYRLLPDAGPLEQADDVAAALAFVQAQAEGWGCDGARLALVGHSSGAHLVSLLAADPERAARAGASPWRATVAIDSAAFDVVKIMQASHFGLYDHAFGPDPAYWRAASPTLRLAGPLTTPLLAVCSARREDSQSQAQAFVAKAQALGGRATLLPIDLSHQELNALLGSPGAYTHAVDAFLQPLGLA